MNKTYIKSKKLDEVNDILTGMGIKKANMSRGEYIVVNCFISGNDRATFKARYMKKYNITSNIIDGFTGCLITNYKFQYK